MEGWGCTGAALGQPHHSAGGTHSPPKPRWLSRVLGTRTSNLGRAQIRGKEKRTVPGTSAFFLAVLPAGKILTPVVVFLCRLRGPHPQSFPISVFWVVAAFIFVPVLVLCEVHSRNHPNCGFAWGGCTWFLGTAISLSWTRADPSCLKNQVVKKTYRLRYRCRLPLPGPASRWCNVATVATATTTIAANTITRALTRTTTIANTTTITAIAVL